jgi:hypothetical protein
MASVTAALIQATQHFTRYGLFGSHAKQQLFSY